MPLISLLHKFISLATMVEDKPVRSNKKTNIANAAITTTVMHIQQSTEESCLIDKILYLYPSSLIITMSTHTGYPSLTHVTKTV